MKTQLLSGNGKRVLSSMLICCLWVCAVPAAARAQAKLGNATCSVKNVSDGRMVKWQMKGTTEVTGLNPQNASTTAELDFQTSNDGGKTWSDLDISVSVTTAAVNGTTNFKTDPYSIEEPAKGQQYRVIVTASYIDGAGKKVAIGVVNSDPETPRR